MNKKHEAGFIKYANEHILIMSTTTTIIIWYTNSDIFKHLANRTKIESVVQCLTQNSALKGCQSNRKPLKMCALYQCRKCYRIHEPLLPNRFGGSESECKSLRHIMNIRKILIGNFPLTSTESVEKKKKKKTSENIQKNPIEFLHRIISHSIVHIIEFHLSF